MRYIENASSACSEHVGGESNWVEGVKECQRSVNTNQTVTLLTRATLYIPQRHWDPGLTQQRSKSKSGCSTGPSRQAARRPLPSAKVTAHLRGYIQFPLSIRIQGLSNDSQGLHPCLRYGGRSLYSLSRHMNRNPTYAGLSLTLVLVRMPPSPFS